MKLSIQAGSTSQTVNIFIQDSSSTTGLGLAGLAFDTASLTAYYALPKAAAVSITLATLAAVTSAYSSGGFKEVEATNMKGWYRLDIPDAALAAGRFVTLHLKGATNMAPCPIEIELTGWNNQDGVRGGMTALPNQAAEAAGGLYTRGTGAGQINQAANGQVNVNVDTIKTNPVVNGGTFTYPSNSTGASTTNVTAGTITTVTNVTNAPSAGDFTATMKTSITAAVPTAVQNADGLIGRNIAGGSSSGRTVGQVFASQRNRIAVSGSTLTVYAEDDTTPLYTATITRTAGNPISQIDPA